MKVILQDINYKGYHIGHYECELPNVKDIDDIPEGKLVEYVIESLDNYIKNEVES